MIFVKRFGPFTAEMEECDEGRMQCWVSYGGGTSSLAAAYDTNQIEDKLGHMIVAIDSATLDEITEWALTHGY